MIGDITREYIEQLNDIEPYCFETDREEQWFNVGLQYGLDIADANPKSPWISVEEDLPCNHDELIYYHNNNNRTINVLVCYKGNVYDIEYMFNSTKMGWNWSDSTPCYWMPIPKLPNK